MAASRPEPPFRRREESRAQAKSHAAFYGATTLMLPAPHRHFHRRPAHEFPIGINIERIFRFNPHPWYLKIFDFRDVQMISAVNGRKQPQQPKSINRTDDAHIQQPIIHLGARSNLHPAAIQRSIGKRGQNRWPIAANGPACVVIGRRRNFHRQRRKSEDRGSQAQHVPTVPPQPARQPIRALSHFPIETDTSHRTEVPSIL